MKKVFKTLSAVFAAAMILSLAACSGDTETEYVDRLVEVPVEATSADVTKVVHMRQNVECTGYSKWQELSENHTAGTKLEALKQDYTGFTPIGLCQTGSTVYVFYDRVTVTVTFDYDGGTSTTTENAASKVYKVVYGTTGVTAPLKPVKDGYHFNYWTVDGTETTPSTTAEQDVVYKANYHAVQNFTVSYVSVHGNGTIDVPCHTSVSAYPLNAVDKGSYTSYFNGWYKDAELTQKEEGEISQNTTLYAKFSAEPTPDGFVEVTGNTITGSVNYICWVNNAELKGNFGQYVVGGDLASRNVTLSSYYIGKTEVTKAQYKAVMSSAYNTLGVKDDPSLTTINSSLYIMTEAESAYPDERPVENMTWYDAVYFCNVYSQKDNLECVYTIENPSVSSGRITSATVTIDLTKKGYRLPTTAEWEYAARGGQETYGTDAFKYEYAGAKSNYVGNGANYPSSTSSDDAPLAVAWCSGNAYNDLSGKAGYGPHRVGQKKANALGIFDMSGNVSEWCNDTSGALSEGEYTNPLIQESGVVYRKKMGGGWDSDPRYLAVTAMNTLSDYSSGSNTGIRLVRTK